MNALARLHQVLAPARAGEAPADPYGGLGAFVDYLNGGITRAGVHVGPRTALGVSTVWACVVVLAEAIGRLPLVTYRRRADGGKERATDHWAYHLLRYRPNRLQTAMEWRSLMQADVETWGNAYALKVRIRGQVRELIHVPAGRVDVEAGPDGMPRYRVWERGRGGSIWYAWDRMFHLRGPFLHADGVRAAAPAEEHRDLFGLALAIEAFLGYSFANGVRPSGVLERPGVSGALSDKALANMKDWLRENYEGVTRASKPLIIEDGFQWKTTQQTNEQGQVAELDDKVGVKVTRVYGVPPHMVGFNISQPRANMEQQAREFHEQALDSRCTRWEQRVNADLFDGEEDVFAEYLLDDLLGADAAARAQFYRHLIELGVLTRNEARVAENRNPLPGLDEPLTPANMRAGTEPPPEKEPPR